MTLDDLARLVNRGFEDVDKQFADIRVEMATKDDLTALADDLRSELATKLELHDLEDRLTKEIRMTADLVTSNALRDLGIETEKRFHAIEKRLEKIEKRAS